MQLADHVDRMLWLGKPSELNTSSLHAFQDSMQKELDQGKDEAQLLWDHHT